MVWAVAAPFFIGSISKGRTVKQTILGGYVFGLGGTFTSFIILGNYSLGLQVSGRLDVMGIYNAGQDLYATIIAVINTLPMAQIVLVLLALAMVTFYATSFDAIALVASAYSYKEIPDGEEPTGVKVFWSLMLILLPHRHCLFRQFHGESPDRVHHRGVSSGSCDSSDRSQLFKGWEEVSGGKSEIGLLERGRVSLFHLKVTGNSSSFFLYFLFSLKLSR